MKNIASQKKLIASRIKNLLEEAIIPLLVECNTDDTFLSSEMLENVLELMNYEYYYLKGLIDNYEGDK